MDFDKLIKARNTAQSFRNYVGVTLKEVKLGEAIGYIDIDSRHYNQIHSTAGGCLYTLADGICGAACATYGFKATTINSTFDYLTPGINCQRVWAHAKEIKHGKRVCVYTVDVFDQDEKLLSQGTFTFAILKEEIDYL